ncbi:MAG TPA: hypothetical protein VMZ24_03640 [Patescibacteria group bacterium]|nr:hypothetical protein [Patescibacteria group bacterium]
MTPESDQQHVNKILTDYVLELLPLAEHKAATRHIARCVNCRQAVVRERQIGLVVKQTLATATADKRKPLNNSWNMQVNHHHFWNLINQGRKQIFLASCLLILALATLGIQLRLHQNDILATTPAILSTAILNTETPTATLLATSEGIQNSAIISPTPPSSKTIPLPEIALAPAAVFPGQLLPRSFQ